LSGANSNPRVPGPVSWSPLGQIRAFRSNPLRFLTGLHHEYGDLVRFLLIRQPAYLISDPDHVRDLLIQHGADTTKSLALRRSKALLGEGLLTSEPPLHTRQRRLMQPAFHRERLQSYGKLMIATGQEWLRGWRERGIAERPFDLHSEMMQLTLSIVVRALFSSDLAPLAEEMSRVTNTIMEMFPWLILPYVENVENWPLPVSRRFRKARERLDGVIYGLIRERRASSEPGADLLAMLLAAQDPEGDGGQMNDKQVRDELLTLFLAGHETTANALAWTWYLLSQNPEAEARFHRELAEVLGEGRTPEVGDFEALPYTTAVFMESMRLYPPAWAIARIPKVPILLGEYEIPAKSLCLACQWVTHRDARYFREPEHFLPERWVQPEDKRPRFAYYPFGAGSRICIGERFAWMEGVLLLAVFGQKWRFRLAPDAEVVPQPVITLRPRYGLKMIAERRGLSGMLE
jgi:cytochrome P450